HYPENPGPHQDRNQLTKPPQDSGRFTGPKSPKTAGSCLPLSPTGPAALNQMCRMWRARTGGPGTDAPPARGSGTPSPPASAAAAAAVASPPSVSPSSTQFWSSSAVLVVLVCGRVAAGGDGIGCGHRVG